MDKSNYFYISYLNFLAINEADVLQKITMPIVPTSECRDAYEQKMESFKGSEKAKVYLDRNICAGGEEGRYIFNILYDCLTLYKSR